MTDGEKAVLPIVSVFSAFFSAEVKTESKQAVFDDIIKIVERPECHPDDRTFILEDIIGAREQEKVK